MPGSVTVTICQKFINAPQRCFLEEEWCQSDVLTANLQELMLVQPTTPALSRTKRRPVAQNGQTSTFTAAGDIRKPAAREGPAVVPRTATRPHAAARRAEQSAALKPLLRKGSQLLQRSRRHLARSEACWTQRTRQRQPSARSLQRPLSAVASAAFRSWQQIKGKDCSRQTQGMDQRELTATAAMRAHLQVRAAPSLAR